MLSTCSGRCAFTDQWAHQGISMSGILSERPKVGRDATLDLQRPPLWASTAALLDRVRRSVGQVGLFGVFGICGAGIGALLPLYSLLVREPVRRANGARGILHHVLRAYIGSMQALRLIDLEVIGFDQAPPPGSLIVANHPSLIDALILLSRVKHGVVVAKRSLAINPFTWGSIQGANYVVCAGAPELVDECRARVIGGEVLVLFPECTRTGADGVMHLRRGAAQIAVRSGCPVIPVTIDFSEPLLTKRSRWWLAPKIKPHVRLVQHATIDPAEFLQGPENPMRSVPRAARALTEHLQALYMKELARRGPA